MAITYDKKRNDITFCTMLFEMPNSSDLAKIKSNNRKFDEFYLPSLKRLIETFGRVALWCDQKTADYITANGLADSVNMHIMSLNELPHWHTREKSLEIMNSMRKYVGYFLHHSTPASYVDYLPLMFAKPAVIDWACKNNKFNSDYFMWIDGGAFSPTYAESKLWDNWTGSIDAHPERIRMAIQPTMGKSRPHYVPRFMYDLYRWLFVPPIAPATSQTLAKQSLQNIAMVNADYDVPGGCFMVPRNLCSDFYQSFERSRKLLNKHNLTCVDQGVFQTMLKLDTDNLFELKYVDSYRGLYSAIANGQPDYILE